MTRHLGFRVGARPISGADVLYDNFELRQAAIECAQRCDALGWADVTCDRVTDEDGPPGEEPCYHPIEWRLHVVGARAA